MRRGPDRIDEERVCIDSLVQHLKGIEGDSSVNAQEESNDPPDYWLTVGEHKFAVEVTSIVTDQGYAALCQSLEDSIKQQHESDSPVAGTYAVKVFRRPNIPRRGSKEWRNLISDALAGIRVLAGSPPGSKVGLLKEVCGDLDIMKWSDEGTVIGMCRTAEAMWQGEVQEELSQLLRQAIDKKLRKIQNKGVMTKCPDVILVLYDAYGYSPIGDAARALSSIEGYDWLHSVFWAASFSHRANIIYPDIPGRAGVFLYSKNEVWGSRA